MHKSHEFSPSRKDLRGSSRATTATLPAINKKALLNDTFSIPLKKNNALTPLTNAPRTPKVNNFLASSSEQGGPLSLTFGSLELAITGGGIHEDDEGLNISHFVKTPEHKRCAKMLTEGFVESFVDFFYLTHKKETNNEDEEQKNESETIENRASSISLHDMPNDVLDFLMERLCEAEDAQREGDATGVVKAYKSLASYFETRRDYNTAIHFHQKGLDCSFRFGHSDHAADAYKCIGVDYEASGNTLLAIQYFDKYSDLVQQNPNNKEAIATSFRHLVTAYRMFAEQLEDKANLDNSHDTLLSAVDYYKKCLSMAKNCADSAAEGTVNYRLGLVYKQLDQVDLSVKHLQNYLLNGDSEGESAACSALADAYISSSDTLQSVKYLEESIIYNCYLIKEDISLAQRTNQPTSQAHACRDLGIIYEQQEDYEKALEYFEKYYSLALASKDRRLVDNARVYLGIARGNMKLMKMFNILNHSITPATMKPMPPRSGSSSSSRTNNNNNKNSSLSSSSSSSSSPSPPSPSSSSSHSHSSLVSSTSSTSSSKERKTPQSSSFNSPRVTNTQASENVVDDDAINAGLEMIRTPRTQEPDDVITRTVVDIPPIPMHTMARMRDEEKAGESPASSQKNEAENAENSQRKDAEDTHARTQEERPRTAHAPRSARSDSSRRPHSAASSSARKAEPTSKEGTPRRPRTSSAPNAEVDGERKSTHRDSDSARVHTPTSSRKIDTEGKESARTEHEERARTPSARKQEEETEVRRIEDGPISRRDTSEGRVRTPKGDVDSEPKIDKEESVVSRVNTPTSSRRGRDTEHEERVRTPSGIKEETEVRARTPTREEKEERIRTPNSTRRRDAEEVRARTPSTPTKEESSTARESKSSKGRKEREGGTTERDVNNNGGEESFDITNDLLPKKICEEEG